MNTVGKISILHVIFLTMTVIGLKNHVTIIPPILRDAGRDGWLSVILATIGLLPWIFLVLYIHRSIKQQPLKEWLAIQIGQKPAKILLYMLALFFIVLAAFTMIETLVWTTTTFLPTTPVFILLVVYTFVCFFLISKDIQTIAIVNVFVLFGVIVLGFFVAFVNLQVKNYELLLPILEHGMSPVWKGTIYPASGFVEIFILLFLQQHYKSSFRWYHLVIILIILMLLTMGPLIGSIIEFGPDEAAKQQFPAYEEWGLASIGRYIEHLDFFSIYQWLTGALIRIVFLLYIVCDMLSLNGRQKRVWGIIAPVFFGISLLLFLFSEKIFLEIKGDYLLKITFYFFIALSIFLLLLVMRSNRKSKKGATERANAE